MGDVDRIRTQRVLARLRTVASELSGCDVADLNEASTFLELGFDSLFLAQLAIAFQHEYGVRITFRQLFDELPTLRGVAEFIDRQLPAETPASSSVGPASVGSPVPDVEPCSGPVAGTGSPSIPALSSAEAYETVQRVMAQQLVVMVEQLQLLRSLARAGATSEPVKAPVAASSEARAATSVAMAKGEAADRRDVPTPSLGSAVDPGSEPIPGSTRARPIPLMAGQREIWIASQMGDVANCAFNESISVSIEGPLDAVRFARAVTAVLAGQESLGYRFDGEGESQWVDAPATFELPTVDLSMLDETSRAQRLAALIDQEALTPFDLATGPLVRGWLAKQGAQSHLLVIYFHHIVFDGYSSEIVMRRIAQAYSSESNSRGASLAKTVPFSAYVDHAELRRTEGAEGSIEYWRTAFSDLPTPLELPTDRPRDSRRGYRGGTLHRKLDAQLSEGIRKTAKALNVSVFVLLLSSFEALISRLSDQEGIVIGVPMAGQAWLDLEAVGYCVNALPVRAAAGYAKPFSELVLETRRELLDAFDHQDVSLGEIVRALHLPRDPCRLPLVEVFFNYSSYSSNLEIEGCSVRMLENPRRAIYYDMFFCITESGGRLAVDWRYCSDLFDESTIARWVDHYSELLKGVVADSQQAIGDLPLLSMDQSAEIAAMWGVHEHV